MGREFFSESDESDGDKGEADEIDGHRGEHFAVSGEQRSAVGDEFEQDDVDEKSGEHGEEEASDAIDSAELRESELIFLRSGSECAPD